MNAKRMTILMVIILSLLIPQFSFSQTILKETVKKGIPVLTIDSLGVKTLHLHIDDAILIADGLMAYEQVVDSILPLYRKAVSDRDLKISLTEKQIYDMAKLSDNNGIYVSNLEKMINKLKEIDGLKDVTIENYESKVKKNKVLTPLKIVGATALGLGFGVAATYLIMELKN